MEEPCGVLCEEACGCNGVNDACQCTGDFQPACRRCWEGTSGTFEVYYGVKSEENPTKDNLGNPLNMLTATKPWNEYSKPQ